MKTSRKKRVYKEEPLEMGRTLADTRSSIAEDVDSTGPCISARYMNFA